MENKARAWNLTNDLDDDIETLFKAVPPLMKLSDGFGYLGVILRKKSKDVIQCHICGEWKRSIGVHVFKAHAITSRDYRMKFQLPLDFPLCSIEVSARRSSLSSSPEQLAILARNRREGCYKKKPSSRRQSKITSYIKTNMSHQNKHGACEEQIIRRYEIVQDMVGKVPSQRDLKRHDDPLRGIIYRKFGTINKFREHYGLDQVKRLPIATEDQMIGSIRKFFDQYKFAPRPKDFVKSNNGSPTAQAIRRRFGSWKRALLASGLTPSIDGHGGHGFDQFMRNGGV